jgi:hypothetical protein
MADPLTNVTKAPSKEMGHRLTESETFWLQLPGCGFSMVAVNTQRVRRFRTST